MSKDVDIKSLEAVGQDLAKKTALLIKWDGMFFFIFSSKNTLPLVKAQPKMASLFALKQVYSLHGLDVKWTH